MITERICCFCLCILNVLFLPLYFKSLKMATWLAKTCKFYMLQVPCINRVFNKDQEGISLCRLYHLSPNWIKIHYMRLLYTSFHSILLHLKQLFIF